MEDKEKIYDELIAPLMTKLLEVCQEHDVPVFAEFQYSNDGFCKSVIYNKGSGHHASFLAMEALSQCKEDAGINLDKFALWCAKTFRNESSIVMSMMGSQPSNSGK